MPIQQEVSLSGPAERRVAIEAAVEASDDGACITPRDGRLLYQNSTMRTMLAAEGDRRRLDTAIADVRQATIARGDLRIRRVQAPSNASGRSSVVTLSARTADAEYRVRGTLVSNAASGEDVVVIWLRRCRPRRLAPALLRERFGLTPREGRVAALLDAGLGSSELAEVLAISVHTARRHVEAVLRKLDVHSRREVRERLRS